MRLASLHPVPHNPKVAGSNPAPATKTLALQAFSLWSLCVFEPWTRVAEPEGRGSDVTARDSWTWSIALGVELQALGALLTTG